MPLNIVYIHSHDTGRYIAPYGFDVPTPRLQAFAEEGTLFRHAFCAAPTCSPSRAALLTGRWAHECGMLGLAHLGHSLTEPRHHLAAWLEDQGYTSVLAGFQHVAPWKTPETPGYSRSWTSGEAELNASSFLDEKPDAPFFLDVGFIETHRIDRGHSQPHHSPGDGDRDARHVAVPPTLPDSPVTRQDFADFQTSAERYDQKVAHILDALERNGFSENTVVLITTDHGIAFPGMKCSLTQHGTGVLLMLRGPRVPRGHIEDALVSHVDIFPTLCDLAGLEKPQWLSGQSLSPILSGEQSEVREETFAEVTWHAAFEPKRSVRTKRWNFIRNFGSLGHPVLPNCDESPSKDVFVQNGWSDKVVVSEELYDLVFDPLERHNLAHEPACAQILEEMRARLNRWMRETADPLLGEGPGGLATSLPVEPELLKAVPHHGQSPQETKLPWNAAEWQPEHAANTGRGAI